MRGMSAQTEGEEVKERSRGAREDPRAGAGAFANGLHLLRGQNKGRKACDSELVRC